MIWLGLIYLIGSIVSLLIQIVLAKRYWKNMDRSDRILTAILWFPFTAMISWLGVLLLFATEFFAANNE